MQHTYYHMSLITKIFRSLLRLSSGELDKNTYNFRPNFIRFEQIILSDFSTTQTDIFVII
jgi:hypothetical protein